MSTERRYRGEPWRKVGVSGGDWVAMLLAWTAALLSGSEWVTLFALGLVLFVFVRAALRGLREEEDGCWNCAVRPPARLGLCTSCADELRPPL